MTTAFNIIVLSQKYLLGEGIRAIVENSFENVNLEILNDIDSILESNKSFNPNLIIRVWTQNSLIQRIEEKFIKAILKRYPNAKMVIYDEYFYARKIPSLFRWGVSGYITNSTNKAEFILCLSEVLSGKRYIANEILLSILTAGTLPQVVLELDNSVNVSGLSRRESEISHCLVRGMRIKDIATKFNRKISTISTIKSNIYRKMNVVNVIELRDKLDKEEYR